jgi:hypothetical protein
MIKKHISNVNLGKDSSPQMANSFNLTFFTRHSRSKSEQRKSIIYMRLTYRGQQVENSTNLEIEPERWNRTQHKALGTSESSKTINKCLEDYRNYLYQIFTSKLQMGEPFTVFDIQAEFLGSNEKQKSLLDLVEIHNKRKESLVGSDISYRTLVRFKTLKKHLSDFMKYQYQVDDIPLHKITIAFIYEFEHYLKAVRQNEHNTAVKYVKNLKTVIFFGLNIDWLQQDPFFKYKAKIKFSNLR